MQTLQSTVLADGFTYGEGPRWRDGRFWFSDMHADAVRTLDANGALGLGASTPHPSGIGWTPDGDLLVTSLEHAVLHRITPDGPQVHCDLTEFGPSLNDMVALPDGRVYVDVYTQRGGGPPNGDLALVAPDGTAQIVAKALATPNGMAVTPDGTALVAAETFGNRLHAWTIHPSSSIAGSPISRAQPDGICLDLEGGAWVGCFLSGEFLRVLDGGEITHRVPVGERWAVAPALGGPEMRTLHLVVNDTTFAGLAAGESTCRIETVEVDIPGAGSP